MKISAFGLIYLQFAVFVFTPMLGKGNLALVLIYLRFAVLVFTTSGICGIFTVT